MSEQITPVQREKMLATMSKLQALANDKNAPKPERDNASEKLAKLKAKYEEARKALGTRYEKMRVDDLIKTAKGCMKEAEKSEYKAEHLWMVVGLALGELKARKPKGPWDDYVRQHFGIGHSRADELIRIGAGLATVEEVRQQTFARVSAASHGPTGGTAAPEG